MSRSRIFLTAMAVAAGVALPGPARAQDGPFSGPTVEVTALGGLLYLDVDGWNPAVGGRLAIHLPNGFGVGASVDRTTRGVEIGDESDDAETWLYAGELRYTIPSATRANFYGFLGVGQARFVASDLEAEALGAEDRTELLIPLGLGMRWYAHGGDPWWALTAEFRDHIVLADEDEATGRDDETTNNYQLSFGLSFLLGGEPQPVD